MANSADLDQLASSEAVIWIYTVCKGRTYPGSARQGLKWSILGFFSIFISVVTILKLFHYLLQAGQIFLFFWFLYQKIWGTFLKKRYWTNPPTKLKLCYCKIIQEIYPHILIMDSWTVQKKKVSKMPLNLFPGTDKKMLLMCTHNICFCGEIRSWDILLYWDQLLE